MAAILAPPGACFPARLNLSSTSRPGSTPNPTQSRDFRRICSRACRILPRFPRLRRRPRGPTARPRQRMWCLRRGPKYCCLWSHAWCRQGGRPFWRRPIPNMPAPPRLPGTASKLRVVSTSAATPRWSLSQTPTIRTADFLLAHDLLALAEDLGRRGGVLVVDEAFMDVGPPGGSLAPDVAHGSIVVLRSFGKFFGLAGLRLGFALAAPATAERLRAALGPWAVSGPALAIGTQALADAALDRADARSARQGITGGSTESFPTSPFLLSVARACSGWCGRPPRAPSSSIWEAPAFGCAPFRTARTGCGSACRPASRNGSGSRTRWSRSGNR